MRKRLSIRDLANSLGRIFRTSDGIQIQILAEEQLLVRKGIVDNPLAGGEIKAEARRPGEAGFDIYVAIHHREAPPVGPSQRMRPPETVEPEAEEPRTLHLPITPAATTAERELLTKNGDLITVRVRYGSEAPIEDINHILSAIHETLLRTRE